MHENPAGGGGGEEGDHGPPLPTPISLTADIFYGRPQKEKGFHDFGSGSLPTFLKGKQFSLLFIDLIDKLNFSTCNLSVNYDQTRWNRKLMFLLAALPLP